LLHGRLVVWRRDGFILRLGFDPVDLIGRRGLCGRGRHRWGHGCSLRRRLRGHLLEVGARQLLDLRLRRRRTRSRQPERKQRNRDDSHGRLTFRGSWIFDAWGTLIILPRRGASDRNRELPPVTFPRRSCQHEPMQIGREKAVTIEYTLKDDGG